MTGDSVMLRLYDGATRRKRTFVPGDPARVTAYVCGPTVYGPAHLGNLRSAVAFDVLIRLLRTLYPAVVHVRNVTDVDDKITAAAAAEGVDIGVIADRFYARYLRDADALGVARPDVEPRATAHVAQVVVMIGALLASGHAYEADGHVLFDVAADPAYGHLSGRGADHADPAVARIERAAYKRGAQDFVLWKPSPPGVPGWESPWGRGRPGWHVECSAMIAEHVGTTVDVHGGGADLLFPHHENEDAQSRCAHGAPLARFWLHNGMLKVSGIKMSKSSGSVVLLDDLPAAIPGEAVRFAMMQAHYRQPVDVTPHALMRAAEALDRLYAVVAKANGGSSEDLSPPAEFLNALYDDVNVPGAAAALFAAAKAARTPDDALRVRASGRLLGVFRHAPGEWFALRDVKEEAIDAGVVRTLLAERADARARRDYASADAVRERLEDMGVAVEDTPEGTRWKPIRKTAP